MKKREVSREPFDLAYTGERHMTAQPGVDLSLGHIDHMIRYASVSPFVVGKRVLDIACGSGYGSQFLALQGADQVVGVDIDQATIEYAQTYHNHPNVTYLRADAHAVPELEEASFDVIISFETIEHIQQPRDFLLELRRVLKPRGQCFLSCPNDYRLSPWISEFHVNRFKFTEFRDLIVVVFGEAIFLGQHNTCTSSLLKPRSISERHAPFEAYTEPLPTGFFGNQYLDSISSIENAAGYFAVVGLDASSFTNQVSVSENSFQQMLTSMHFYDEEAKKAKLETETAKKAIVELRQQVEAEKSLRTELDATRAQTIATLQQKLQEQDAARAQELATLRQKLREQDAVQAQELATLRQKLQEQDTAHAQTITTLRQKLQEQEVAHGEHIISLEKQLEKEQSVRAENDAERVRAETLAQELRARIAAMESSKFWKLRRVWFRLKGTIGLAGE
jgi:2-polyprenyl-3-methyl-5-hydroxy-6-metoxy-1,4-benzoquinol methylase